MTAFAPAAPKRVAIVHYWLLHHRGGEQVVQGLLRKFPQADLFTLFHEPAYTSKFFPGTRVVSSWLDRIPGARKKHSFFLPLMPRALEDLDLGGYDLVISSESGPAKGVLVDPEALHLCYVHSPMRYLYDQRLPYERSLGFFPRWALRATSHGLRQWDAVTALRVASFASNSRFVARRVKQVWGRDSVVIHPPVEVDRFAPGEGRGYYLLLSQLVPYKRADLAVAACSRSGRRLLVVGEGPEEKRLRKMAGPSVEFLGRVDFERRTELYAHCRALLFPGVEDFGITPVEANAAGKPVIALRRGGILDSQTDETAVWFEEESVESLEEALGRFEASRERYESSVIRANARRFSIERFDREIAEWVDRAWSERR